LPEAPLDDVGFGLAPARDGWFVVNARDAVWLQLAVLRPRTQTAYGQTMALDLYAGIPVRDSDAARSLYDMDGNQIGLGGAPLEAGAGERL
jgi:hypothetical protein